jgi:hypothetical protein
LLNRLWDALGGGQGGLAVYQFGHLFGQDALGFRLAIACLVGFFDGGDFCHRQEAEVAQELVHVGIGGAQPELVEGVGRGFARIQPDGAGFGFAELGAIGLGDQRHGQAEHLLLVQATGEVGTGGDIAPLVGTANLQLAAQTAVQLGES